MILFLSRAMRRASSTLTNRVYSTFTDPDALGGIIGGPITIVYMTGSAAAIVAASLTYGMVGILSSLLLVPLASPWLAHGTVMGIAAGNKTFIDTVTGVIRAAWTLMVVGPIQAAWAGMVVGPIPAVAVAVSPPRLARR